MQPRARTIWLAAIALSVLALIACGGLALLTPGAVGANRGGTAPAELAEARSRWAARAFTDYHLEVEDHRCKQVYDVRADRVRNIEPNRCDAYPRTVDELFTLIERDNTKSLACVIQGCTCDDFIYVDAEFDPALGYPRSILVRIIARPNWQHPDFWERAIEQQRFPDCKQLTEGSKLIQVLSLKPLP